MKDQKFTLEIVGKAEQKPEPQYVAELVGKEDTLLETAGKSFMLGAARVGSGVLDFLSVVGEGIFGKTKVIDYLRQAGQDAREFWTPKVEPRSAKYYVGEIVSSATQNLLNLLLTRGGLGTVGLMGVEAGGTKAAEELEKGTPYWKAVAAGGVTGTSEAVTEYLPFKMLIRPGVGFFKRLLGLTVTDLPGELINTATEMKIADEMILGRKYSLDDYKNALIDTTIITLGSAGLVTSATHPFVRGMQTLKDIPAEQLKQDIEALKEIKKEKPAFYKQQKIDLVPEEKITTPEEVKPEVTPVPETAKEEAVKSDTTTFAYTPDNKKIEFEFAVVPAEKLIASHDITGKENPQYPQELQPRQRDRQASLAQIYQMAQNINPELLAESRTVTDGSPIVGEDLVVESGNARAIALKQAYAEGKAAHYKQYLIQNAQRFGLKPEDVAKIENPVLVRIRKTPVDRKQFAYVANTRTTLAMSPAEQAIADAKRIPDNVFLTLDIDEKGNISLAKSREFINAFLSTLPQQEQAQYIAEKGYTKQLHDRLQALLFAKAYQDARLISLMAEETDVDIKNIINALNQSSKTFALLKAKYDDFGITNKLVDAINLIRDIKARGLTFDQWQSQLSMFERPDNVTMMIANHIAKNIRSAKALGELFNTIAIETYKEAEFASQPNLMGATPRNAQEIVADALLKRTGQLELQIVLPEHIEKNVKELAKLYNNRQLLDLIDNSSDPLVSKVLTALNSAYKKFVTIAKTYKEAEKYDMFGHITEAVSIVSRASQSKMLVEDFIKTGDLFGKEFSQEAIEIAKYLQANSNSQRNISIFFNSLAGNIEKVLQGYKLNEAEKITRLEVIKDEVRKYQQTKINWEGETSLKIGDYQGYNQVIREYQEIINYDADISYHALTESTIDQDYINETLGLFNQVLGDAVDYDVIFASDIYAHNEVLKDALDNWKIGNIDKEIQIAGLTKSIKIDGNQYKQLVLISMLNKNERTAPHEIWHIVERMLLTKEEVNALAKVIKEYDGATGSDARANAFANYVLRLKKYPKWVVNLFTRIETFFDAVGLMLKGRGFNYVDVVRYFDNAIKGKYKDRVLQQRMQEKIEADINSDIDVAIDILGKPEEERTVEEKRKLARVLNIKDSMYNNLIGYIDDFNSPIYRRGIPTDTIVDVWQSMAELGELDNIRYMFLKQYQDGIIDEQQFSKEAHRIINIDNKIVFDLWKEQLDRLIRHQQGKDDKIRRQLFSILMLNKIFRETVVYDEQGNIKTINLTPTVFTHLPQPAVEYAINKLYQERINSRAAKIKLNVRYFEIVQEVGREELAKYKATGYPATADVKGIWLEIPERANHPSSESFQRAVALIQYLSHTVTTVNLCIRGGAATTYLTRGSMRFFLDENDRVRVIMSVDSNNKITELRGVLSGQDIETEVAETIRVYADERGLDGGRNVIDDLLILKELKANKEKILNAPPDEQIKIIQDIANKYGHAVQSNVGSYTVGYQDNGETLILDAKTDNIRADTIDFGITETVVSLPSKQDNNVNLLSKAGIEIQISRQINLSGVKKLRIIHYLQSLDIKLNTVDLPDVEKIEIICNMAGVMSEGVVNITTRRFDAPKLKTITGTLKIRSQINNDLVVNAPLLEDVYVLTIDGDIDTLNLKSLQRGNILNIVHQGGTYINVELPNARLFNRIYFSNIREVMFPQLESSKEITLSYVKRIYMPQLVESDLIDVSSYNYTQEAIFMAQNLRQVGKMRGVKTYFYVPLLEKAERMRLKESKLHAESLMQARMETFDADIYAPKLSNSDLLDLYETFLYAPNLNNVGTLDAENHTRKQFINYSPDRSLVMLYMPNLQKVDIAHAGNTTLFAPNAEVNKLSHRDAIVYTKSFKVDEALKQHSFYDDYSDLDDFMNKNIRKIENIVDNYIKRTFNIVQRMDNLAKELGINPESETIELDINKRFLESLNKNPTPAYQRAISKMETAISDVHDRFAEIIRTPYWNKVLNPLVTTLMKITSRAHTITYESKQYMKPYYELKDKTRVNQMLLRGDEIGKTFKRYELEGAGLTEQEIQAYYGVRKAIDYVQKVGLKRFMIDAGFTEQEADDFIKAHYLEGYLPHVRGGRFGVWIGVPDEETGKRTLYYETFDTMAEAKTFAETILKDGLPKDALIYARDKGISVENPNIFILDTKTGDATHIAGEGVEKGMLIGFVYREPAMMSILHRYIPMLEQYLKAKGVTDEDITKLTSIVDKEYLKVFAGGRLAKRAGIAGYDIDVEAIVKEYITNAPLAFARRFYYVEVMEELGKIAKNNMEYYLYAKDLIDYFYGRKDYESRANIRLRTLIYLYHLAWKPAFLVVNMTQRFMTTIWKAHADAGMKGFEIFGKVSPLEFRLYTDALFKYRGDFLKAVDNAKYLSEEAKEVIHRLFLEGELEAVMHYDIGFKDKLTNALAIFGTLSERSNRINAALVATEIAKHKGLSGEVLYEYTLKFIRDTQFPYSMANRPILGRGVFAPYFVFKSYMFNYFNFLRSLYPNKKSFMGALLTALALCGAEGLPFLNQIVDLIMSILDDYDPTARFKLREITKNIPDFVRKGIFVRIGIDGSITWGMSELFGVAAVPIAQEALLGMSLAYQYSQGRDIDFAEIVKRMSPAMVKRIINANVIWQQGIPSDMFGKPYFTVNDLKKLPKALRIEALKIYNDMPREIPTHEKVLYTLGFTTPTLNTFYDNLSLIKETTENYKQLSSGYARDVAKALYKKDYDKATQLIQEAYSRGIYLQRQAIRHHLQEYMQSGQNYIRLTMEEEHEEAE